MRESDVLSPKEQLSPKKPVSLNLSILKGARVRNIKERLIELFLLICAISSVLVIFLIIYFIFSQGLPFLVEVGPSFLTGSIWQPTDSFANGTWGIFPIIIGSLIVTLGAIGIGTPLGIACAVFLAELAPPYMRRILTPSINALAGVPSVVYGFFGLIVIVPWIRGQFGGFGASVLACWIILAIMILPTVISISQDSIRAVPREYKEGSLRSWRNSLADDKECTVTSSKFGDSGKCDSWHGACNRGDHGCFNGCWKYRTDPRVCHKPGQYTYRSNCP